MMTIGTKVRVKSSSTVQGLEGVIVAVNQSKKHAYGVEFDQEVAGGHDCDGAGDSYSCRWLSAKQIEPTRLSNHSVRSVRGSSNTNKKGGSVLKKLTTFLSRTLGDSASQYKIGWLEVVDDELVPTQEGLNQLSRYLMIDNKEVSAAMNKLAKEQIKTIKADKKGDEDEAGE